MCVFLSAVVIGILFFLLICEVSAAGHWPFTVSEKISLAQTWLVAAGMSGLAWFHIIFLSTISFEEYVPFPLVLSQKSLLTPPSYSQ